MRSVVLSAFGLVVVGSLLACGGIMSQAAGDILAESRTKVAGCGGDGQPAMLATIDAAIAGSSADLFSFSDLVLMQVAVDEAVADGSISTDEAVSFGEVYTEAATN